MNKAKKQRLESAGVLGEARLSCQIILAEEMSLTPLMSADDQPGWNGDTGPMQFVYHSRIKRSIILVNHS